MDFEKIVTYNDFDLKGHLLNMSNTLKELASNVSDFDNNFTAELEVRFLLRYEEPTVFEIKTKKFTKEVK